MRCQGEQSTCIVYGDLPSYVYLRIQLFANVNDADDYAHSSIPDDDGHNLAISSWKQAQILTKKKTYPLSVTRGERYASVLRRNCMRSFDSFVSVLAVSMHEANRIYQLVSLHIHTLITRHAAPHVLSAQSGGMRCSFPGIARVSCHSLNSSCLSENFLRKLIIRIQCHLYWQIAPSGRRQSI